MLHRSKNSVRESEKEKRSSSRGGKYSKYTSVQTSLQNKQANRPMRSFTLRKEREGEKIYHRVLITKKREK